MNSPKRIFWLAMALSVMASFSVQAAFQITKPAKGETVSPLKPMQRALTLMTEEQLDILLDQETVSRMREFTTYPAGIEVVWKPADEAPGGYRLCVADNAEMANPRQFHCAETSYVLHNLEIGKTYYLQVQALGAESETDKENVLQTTPSSDFTVEDRPPRVLYVPGVPNVRDLGGYVGLEGRRIPQGMIFRSAAFNDNSPDGKKIGKTRMTEENRDIVLDVMKLKTEIDLRWDRELAGMNESPVDSQVQYVSIPSTLYGGLFSRQGYDNYRMLFEIFAKPENYPIDFHCILGADRTGSLAVVLLATLGVSRAEIIRDYCFTSFYDGFLRPPRNIRSVLDGLAACGQSGDTLSDQAMRFLLRCGIRSNQIFDFLTIVLGDGLALPEVLAQAKINEEIHDHFNQPQTGLAVKPYIVRQETMLQAGKEVSWTLPVWHDNPLNASGTNGKGAFYLLLQNTMSNPTTVALEADHEVLTAQGYFVVAPMKRLSYLAPDGSLTWTPEQLNGFHAVLNPSEELLLVVQPSAMLNTDGYQVVQWEEPSFVPCFAEIPATIAPVLDGLLGDETWQGLAPFPLSGIQGEEVENAPLVWLRTNAEHDTLYVAAKLTDATPCAEVHAERDASLWNEDSIEIFLSSHGEATTYQIILNAEGNVWDGVIDGSSEWTAEVECKTARIDGGWTIEAEIPLSQFYFEKALELNICANNNPGDIHFNLFTTHGAFHERSAISPVLFK